MTSNNDKILKVLKTKKELITTTELSNETNIDIKNISRYLKALEQKGIIVRKTIQEGKIRLVKIGMNTEKNIEKTTEVASDKKPDTKLNFDTEKKTLHPPPAPRPPKQEIEQEFFIDFNKIANNSSFQRFIIEAIKMSVPQLKNISARTSKEVMSKAFNERITEIDNAVNVYDEIKEIGRGTHKDYREVVDELKLALAKQKVKVENE